MTHLVGMTVVAWLMRQNPAVTVYVQVKLIYISPVTFKLYWQFSGEKDCFIISHCRLI